MHHTNAAHAHTLIIKISRNDFRSVVFYILCVRQRLARPPRSSFDGRSTFFRLFVLHYFTLPLGPVRLAFTQFHKSFDLQFVIRSTLKLASNARRIHKTVVRRSSCSSTLFHRRKKRVRLAFLGEFFPYVSPYAKRTSFCTTLVHRRTMTWGGGLAMH